MQLHVEKFNNVKNVCHGLRHAPAHNSCNVPSYMWLVWDNYEVQVILLCVTFILDSYSCRAKNMQRYWNFVMLQ